MLTNLLTNAWEAVGDLDATLHLAVTRVRSSDIPTAHRFAAGWTPGDQDYACLEVTDPGYGIEDDEIDKIFDPFFTTKLTGRGLGLPVVLGILHAHSGGLVVHSKRGRDSGSSFRAYLPISVERVARPAFAAPVEHREEALWGGTVLLAEDEEGLRSTTRTILARLGFSVVEARDGIEALEVFRRHQDEIRLVVCDLTMPHMDGWEALAAMRRLSPGIPVLLTSGYDEADVMAEDHDEQPQAFLAKPYPIEALRIAIRRALASGKS
jgi:CheY-like chemotaxis protein